MDRDRKIEIVDEYIGEALKKVYEDYKGEIQLVADSYYSTGRIIIKVME